MPRGKKPKRDAQHESLTTGTLNFESTAPRIASEEERGTGSNSSKNQRRTEQSMQHAKNDMDSKTNNLSNEKFNIASIVESKMSEVFAEQYEQLKEKLITLMAQQVSKLIAKVDNIEQEFLKYKEDHQDQSSNVITIADNNAELEAIKNSQAKKSAKLSKNSNQLSEFRVEIDSTKQKLRENNVRL